MDMIDNSIVVCPNYHARIHELQRITDREKLLDKIKKIEAKEDKL